MIEYARAEILRTSGNLTTWYYAKSSRKYATESNACSMYSVGVSSCETAWEGFQVSKCPNVNLGLTQAILAHAGPFSAFNVLAFRTDS